MFRWKHFLPSACAAAAAAPLRTKKHCVFIFFRNTKILGLIEQRERKSVADSSVVLNVYSVASEGSTMDEVQA